MKQKHLLNLLFLLCALIAGSLNVWGQTQTTAIINFGSANGSTSISGSSSSGTGTVTYTDSGDDNDGNTWTITTITSKNKSFTQSAAYSQIGSSNQPVTSITFTTTLPDEVTITEFSAKFGGFSGTTGLISLKVDDNEVASGALNAANDVTVSTTSSVTGTELKITVENITKGVKAYYISYSYESNDPTPTDPYTVTLGDNSATLTEASAGAGVTLPSRSDVGSYTFVGWTTSNIATETTTAPTIIPAGTYNPTSDITLYPVYTRTEGGGNTDSNNVFSSGSYNNNDGTITWSIANVVSILQEQNGSSNTAPNSSYVSAPRWYSGNKITITPSVSINSIAVTATNASYATTLANSTYTNASANVDANNTSTVIITPSNGSNAITIVMGAQSRLSSLTVNYAAGTTYYISTPSGQERVATPTITIPTGVFVSTKTVTINCETDGAAITYSTDNGANWTSYSAPFIISETTTVQAKATKSGMDDSDVATATFTKETVLQGLSALTAQTNTSDVSCYVSLTNAQVTWANGSNGYMEDNTTGVYLYNVTPTLNKVYNGIFQVTYQLYNSMPEIKAITDVEGTIASGSAKAATVMTAAALDAAFDANLGRQIQINGVAVTSDKELTSNIKLYESDPYTSVSASTTYNLVGYPFYAKVNDTTTKQFRITSASEVELQANAITGIGNSYTVDLANGEDEVDLSGATATSGATVQYAVQSSTIDANDYELTNGVLTVTGNGVIVIRAYVNANATYNGAEKVVTVTVKDNPVIGYADETETTAFGTPYTLDESMIEGGTVSLVSGNDAVATVDGLTITPVAVGSVTITVNTEAADIWHAGSATFTLNVTQPTGGTTANENKVITTTFTDKDLHYNEGGIDWTASIGANSFESADPARGVQFGAAKGEFTLTATGKNVKKVSMVLSTNGTGNTIEVSVGSNVYTTTYGVEEGDDPISELTLTSGMSKETVEFTGDAGDAVTISVNDANKSVYFTSITLYEEADPITAKLNASGYATFCSQYPLDFSSASDYSAWQITGVNSNTGVVTFSQITGSIKGGQGILLKGTAGETITLTSSNSDTELSGNKLEGTLAPTYVAADTYYGLSGNTFMKVNAGTVKAGKALLPASALSGSGARALTFVFADETTGISTVESGRLLNDDAMYNLNGQRVVSPKKGLYIVNGKKVWKN